VFVVAPLVVTPALGSLADDRAGAWGLTVLLPLLVTLAGVAVAVLLIRLVLRDIARPFHSAGANIRSNADQLSTAVQRLAATTPAATPPATRRPGWASGRSRPRR
jgi:hypothetical protein